MTEIELVAASEQMKGVMGLVERVKRTDLPVLLTGETGTGKSRLAKLIHNDSLRAGKPLVTIDSGFLNTDLWWAHLFGQVRGTFTGATHDKDGLFKIANQGTVLIEEVGDMSLPFQIVLLRILEEGEFVPLGATTPVKTNVRVISATNKDLPAMVKKGEFRSDLYYRLKGMHVCVPPLRDRRADIQEVVERCLWEGPNGDGQRRIDNAVMDLLFHYSWPGNIRELLYAMRGMMAMSDGEILIGHAPPELLGTDPMPKSSRVEDSEVVPLYEVEKRCIIAALAKYKGDKKRAAEALQISLKTLYNRINEYKGAGAVIPDFVSNGQPSTSI